MSPSPRTWMELIGTGLMAAVIAFLLISRANVRTELANQKVATKTETLKRQAAEVSQVSCQAALGEVQKATQALSQATESAHRLTADALQRGQERDQAVSSEVTRLLRVRATPGQDCQSATGLARAAWLEGQ